MPLSDDNDWTHYWPREFSADNSWLLISVGKWEDGWLAVTDLSTKTITRIDAGAGAEGNWLGNKNQVVTTVIHTEYTGCGQDEGIHRVSAAAANVLDERIYFEQIGEYLYDGYGPRDLRVSPNGESVLFVQDNSDEFGDRIQSKLMLFLFDDFQAIEVASITGGEIISPIWSNDAGMLYYAQRSKDPGIYRVDIVSAGITPLASLNSIESIYQVSPDGNWLVISQELDRVSNLNFLNLSTGAIVSVNDLGVIVFLGWK